MASARRWSVPVVAGSLCVLAPAASGRFGKGLSFDGVNDSVSVPDADSLDLTRGMTLEAWVKPSALGSAWRTAILKERPGDLVYALYANTNGGRPVGQAYVGGYQEVLGASALPLNRWTHLATTYDGAAQRLYVGGVWRPAARSPAG